MGQPMAGWPSVGKKVENEHMKSERKTLEKAGLHTRFQRSMG